MIATYRSFESVRTEASRCTVFMPVDTLPKIVCFPSSQGVGPNVRKNWLPMNFQIGSQQSTDINHVPRAIECTVGIGTRVRHRKDTSSYESQIRVNLIRTLHRPGSFSHKFFSQPIGSTHNFSPYIYVPPRPVPDGSPPCTIKSCGGKRAMSSGSVSATSEGESYLDHSMKDDIVVVSSFSKL